MNKIGLMEIAQRYSMEFARNEITREGCGVYGTYSALVLGGHGYDGLSC